MLLVQALPSQFYSKEMSTGKAPYSPWVRGLVSRVVNGATCLGSFFDGPKAPNSLALFYSYSLSFTQLPNLNRLVAAGSACALAIFVCFSGAAILSRQRKYILLGGLLSSAVSTLALLRIMSFWFGGYLLVFQLEV